MKIVNAARRVLLAVLAVAVMITLGAAKGCTSDPCPSGQHLVSGTGGARDHSALAMVTRRCDPYHRPCGSINH